MAFVRSCLLVALPALALPSLAACGGDDDGAPASDAGPPRPDARTGPAADGGASGSAYRNAIMADGPVGYWRLGESDGTTAHDEIGDAHPGTHWGGTTLGVPGILDDDPAVRFDGTSGCIAMGDAFRFAGRVAFSAEAWVNLDAYGENGTRVISTEGFPTGIRSGWSLSASYGDSGYPYFDAWNSDGEPSVWTMGAYASTSPAEGLLPLGEWVHLVGTYRDDQEEIWVNGVRRDRQNQTGGPIPTLQHTFTIGCAGDGSGNVYLGAHGVIDEVAVYDKVLTEAQIQNHYMLGRGPTR